MQKLRLGSRDLCDLASSVLADGGSISFKASGTSMHPTLQEGDYLTAEAVDPADLRNGDIILYRTDEGRAAVHRIARAGTDDEGVITISCDATPGDIYPVPEESVLGRIVSTVRKGHEVDTGRTGMHDRSQVFSLRNAAGIPAALAVMLSGIPLYRELVSSVMRHRIEYRVSRCTAPEGSSDCWWDQLSATVFGIRAGSAQLVRFQPGTPFGDFPWLFSMNVRRPFRGWGMGRGLTLLALDTAEAGNEKAVGLIVSPSNSAAVNLYRSEGFQYSTDPNLSRAAEEAGDATTRVMIRILK